MRTNRASAALCLLLAVNMTLPAFGENGKGPGAKSDGATATAQTLPPEVATALKEQVDELTAQVNEMKRQLAELQELRQRDKAAFEARLAQDEAKLAAQEQKLRDLQAQQ